MAKAFLYANATLSRETTLSVSFFAALLKLDYGFKCYSLDKQSYLFACCGSVIIIGVGRFRILGGGGGKV